MKPAERPRALASGCGLLHRESLASAVGEEGSLRCVKPRRTQKEVVLLSQPLIRQMPAVLGISKIRFLPLRGRISTLETEFQQATKFYLKVRVHVRDSQRGSSGGVGLKGSSS